VEGIFDALRRWTLDPRWARDHGLGDPNDNLAGPFRGSAWCGCYGRYDQAAGGTRYLATKPIYPDYPEAVNYTGTFLGYSWCFNLDTTQAELILKLDTAIQVNMQTEKYLQARKSIAASRNTGCSTPLNNSA
jgi:hypothetical protein